MINIDECIEKVKNKENISNGGSEAYDFGDVILVKYTTLNKYGIARKNEELIAEAANEKNKMGVNTPVHLAIKRTYEGEYNICWVLQEKAKGVSFNRYYTGYNNATQQLHLQKELSDAPDYHYEKCIRDLSELFNMGLELKPKNIFYDNKENGVGFTFIDLLDYNQTPMNPDNISDILAINRMAQFICNFTRLSSYTRGATENEINESTELYYKIRTKIFNALEKVVPNFSKYKKWILRTYSDEELKYLEKNGVNIGTLSLTEEDYNKFNDYVETIITTCIEKIATGKNLLWQIEVNEIRIMLDEMGMRGAWKRHSSNPIKNKEDYEDEWEFNYENNKYLESLVYDLFGKSLSKIAENSSNPYILQANNELIEKKRSHKVKDNSWKLKYLIMKG